MMDRIRQELEKGGAVVLPTETVYGLFAKALDEKAVDHVYQLKRRPRDKALNLNVASLEDILHFSKNQPTYLQKLVEVFLPGPLTIILEANDRVPYWVNSGPVSYTHLILLFQPWHLSALAWPFLPSPHLRLIL